MCRDPIARQAREASVQKVNVILMETWANPESKWKSRPAQDRHSTMTELAKRTRAEETKCVAYVPGKLDDVGHYAFIEIVDQKEHTTSEAYLKLWRENDLSNSLAKKVFSGQPVWPVTEKEWYKLNTAEKIVIKKVSVNPNPNLDAPRTLNEESNFLGVLRLNETERIIIAAGEGIPLLHDLGI